MKIHVSHVLVALPLLALSTLNSAKRRAVAWRRRINLNQLDAVKVFMAASILSSLAFTALAQGTAFTYQGQLQNNGSPASGTYDLQFLLYTNNSASSAVAGPVTTNGVMITNGLFTVLVDFGAGVFTGSNYWLQIGVETNGVGSFTPLMPRQQLTPVPYAVYAENSGGVNDASISASQFNTLGAPASGQVLAYNGTSLVWSSPATGGGTSWSLTGNAGTSPASGNFLGTTDNNPLELHVNSQRALRLDPNGNFIGGSAVNFVVAGVMGATIGGRGGATFGPLPSSNLVTGSFGTVGGGSGNTASNLFATVSGGAFNVAGGGQAAVGGGNDNLASGQNATIPGGFYNDALGDNSFAAGQNAVANDNDSFVWGDGTRIAYSQGANSFAVLATGGVFFYTTTNGTDVVLDKTGDLDFGTTTRQMLNLWSTSYGIGVQSSDEYFRSGGQFYWYQGGSHDNGNGNAGGGATLMTLSTSGLTVNGMMSFASDRNLKEHLQAVDAQRVLAAVSALPISRWNYKTDPKGVQHIGPMAQDFQAAFQLSADDKHISVVDEGGVALAAIQGLNEKVEVRSQKSEVRIQKLEAENAELKQQNDLLAERLNDLEATLKQLAANK